MKTAVPLELARAKAECLLHYLAPVCDRVEIAGSIRRKKAEVGDIEIVAIPTMFPPEEKDLFGNVIGKPADRIMAALTLANTRESRPACTRKNPCSFCEGGEPCDIGAWLGKLNNGTRYLKLWDRYLGIQIDLFLVRPPAEWGPLFAIRTGPAKFSQRLVTGLHVRKLKCEDGHVIEKKTGKHVPCPDERQFFKLAGFRWKEPEERR